MKQIFPAVFSSVWKRKETKIYLLFALFSLVYFIASFFGKSNFMQISVQDTYRIANITFIDIMVNSVDSFILPTLAVYFLTISVFKREIDDHTMFLYRDISRIKIFFSKYFSLISVVTIFYLLFFVVSTIIYYTRVVQLPFASGTFFESNMSENLNTFLDLFSFFMKDIFSITVATVVCLYSNVGTTMVTAVVLTITMMLTPIIGGPVALLFPNGYLDLGSKNMLLGFGGTALITIVYAIVFTGIGMKKFKSLEF